MPEGRPGPGCPKGPTYARQEAVDPGEVLTTLKGADGQLISGGGVPGTVCWPAWRPSATASSPRLPLSSGADRPQDPFGLGVDVVVTGSPMEMNYMHNKK